MDDSFGSEGTPLPTTGILATARAGSRYGSTRPPLVDANAGDGVLGGTGGDNSLEGNVVVVRALQNEAAGVIQQGVRAHQARQAVARRRQAAKSIREEADAFLVIHPLDISTPH